MDLILGGVDAPGLGEDLGGDLLVAADRSVRSRGGELGAVDRDHADVDDPGLPAEPEDLAEESRQPGEAVAIGPIGGVEGLEV